MLDEFKRSLLDGTEPATTAAHLIADLKQEMKDREREIEHSRQVASFLWVGMKQPAGSVPRIVAEGFLHQFEADLGIEGQVFNKCNLADQLMEEASGNGCS